MIRFKIAFTGVFLAAAIFLIGVHRAEAKTFQVTGTLSGTGQAGLADGNRQAGQLNRPHGLAIDARGNVYVSDRGNHAIRVVTMDKPLPKDEELIPYPYYDGHSGEYRVWGPA